MIRISERPDDNLEAEGSRPPFLLQRMSPHGKIVPAKQEQAPGRCRHPPCHDFEPSYAALLERNPRMSS